MGLFGRKKEEKKAEEKPKPWWEEEGLKPSDMPIRSDLDSAQLQWVRPEDVDWTGWAEKPKPGLRWPTGDPVVFPKPPDGWKPVRWCIRDWRIPRHPAINPTTGRTVYLERRDGKRMMIFREGNGTERGILDCSPLQGDMTWSTITLEELNRRWIKPKDLKEREKLIREFMIDSALFSGFPEFWFVSGPMIEHGQFPEGILSKSAWRTGYISISENGKKVAFFNPQFVPVTP
jgi:hypothetical protein